MDDELRTMNNAPKDAGWALSHVLCPT